MKTLTQQQNRRFANHADIPKTYRELCEVYLPRPIHNDVEDEEATAMMLGLAVFSRLNAEQRDYLDVLTELVDEYDKGKKIRRPKVTGLDALRHLLEANDMSAADLARLLGVHRTLGAMILRGERQLTLAHVRALARRFKVSADLFFP
ncbi:MAG: helix-turn-helix domain-containing protein [Limisphaerales bacterium]